MAAENTISICVVPLSMANMGDADGQNEPFRVFGWLVPAFADGRWTWTEELFSEPWEKRYPGEDRDFAEYIDNPDKAAFLAYVDGQSAGRVRVRKYWNGFGQVEDVAVNPPFRKKGVGRALMQAAVEWAKKAGMKGLTLETQDNNLAACRLYSKCGFILCGADTMLYHNTPYKTETALYWYLPFDGEFDASRKERQAYESL